MLATPHWSTWLSEERRFLGFKERVLLFSLKGSFYSCQFLGYSNKQYQITYFITILKHFALRRVT